MTHLILVRANATSDKIFRLSGKCVVSFSAQLNPSRVHIYNFHSLLKIVCRGISENEDTIADNRPKREKICSKISFASFIKFEAAYPWAFQLKEMMNLFCVKQF